MIGSLLLEYSKYKKNIVITQPRTLTTQNISETVAKLEDVELGTFVGYQFKNNRKVSSSTKLRFVTDGLLVQQAYRDPLLKDYSFVVIDEFHERNVYIDILSVLLKKRSSPGNVRISKSL